MTYNVDGLSEGNHGFHVHTWGNIEASDGSSVGGHFVGDCVATDCRPGTDPEEVGNLWDGAGIDAGGGGRAVGMQLDSVIVLEGSRSVLGRSIVVHGEVGDTSIRVGQCVIGEGAVVAGTDCVYSEWGSWGACDCSSGDTSGVESRSRSVVTPAANGGLPCDDMTSTRSCTGCKWSWLLLNVCVCVFGI